MSSPFLLSLLLLPASIFALPQSGPVAPADLVPLGPATPRYDLTCPQLERGISAGNPSACQNLILNGITTLPSPMKFITKDHSPVNDNDAFPLTLSSTKFPTYDNNGKALYTDDECTVTFSFLDGTDTSHKENWGTELLKKNAILAWGKCMVQPDGGVVSPNTYARIVPKPWSETSGKLVIEIKSVSKSGSAVNPATS